MSFFTTPLLFLLLFFVLFSTIFIVRQQTAVIIERFGKFQSVRGPGFQLKIPLVDRIAGKLSLKVLQLDVVVETKTSDDIAVAVKQSLGDAMEEYGYFIVKALVTDIEPDAEVKKAMNRINAADREKTAAQYEGDAARILIVEKAKAEAESKRLQGQGIADQRREIAKGIEDSVGTLGTVGINSQEASALIVVTQHYDTLQSIGGETNSNLILLPNSPQAGSTMLNDMVAAFTASSKIGEAMQKENAKNPENKFSKPKEDHTKEFGEENLGEEML
jgi:regulator of protease activity HflC (stomatin/prohibitin superfamily)